MAKIAICGYGTVGSGVAEVIAENADSIARNAAEDVSIKYILDKRDFPGDPFEKQIVHDFAVIENDPEVSVVVETMGGCGAAFEFTKRALLAGKSVVTSNKELVSTKGHELIAIAKEKNLNYLFEASVGGGIPIIRPITQCLTANKLDEVYGILNGTTNYILTEMIQNSATFADALQQAQRNGFAEADPTADIEEASRLGINKKEKMMAKITKINHVAIAVKDIDESLTFWRDILGMQVDHVEDVPSQKAVVAFLPTGDSEVELVKPTVDDSGVAKFIAERGGGIHHLCLETDDIVGMLAILKEKGVRLIDEVPRELPGRKMAFIHPKSTGGVLAELYEVIKK